MLRSSEKVIDRDKICNILPKLETVDVILLHCIVVNNSFQQT